MVLSSGPFAVPVEDLSRLLYGKGVEMGVTGATWRNAVPASSMTHASLAVRVDTNWDEGNAAGVRQ